MEAYTGPPLDSSVQHAFRPPMLRSQEYPSVLSAQIRLVDALNRLLLATWAQQ